MTHRLAVRVWYEDTDLAGVVYHANYLKFIERGRSDWLAELGVDQRALKDEGVAFVVRRIDAEFVAPARFGDDLSVATVPVRIGGARIVLDQRVERDGALLFDARVTVAALGPRGRPVRLPAALTGALAGPDPGGAGPD